MPDTELIGAFDDSDGRPCSVTRHRDTLRLVCEGNAITIGPDAAVKLDDLITLGRASVADWELTCDE